MVTKIGRATEVFKVIKNWFLTGLFILLPLGITVIIVSLLLDYVGAPASKLLLDCFGLTIPDKFWMGTVVNLFSTVFIVGIITLLGFLSKYFLGRTIIHWTERLIDGVPFVRGVYKTVKQIVETFSRNREAVFQTTVLIEYPRKGLYAIGFLTSESEGEVQEKTAESVVNVFLPTTPNPTSGFLLLVPRNDIIFLDMTVADGMKMIISGGVVNPNWPSNKNEQVQSKPSKPVRKSTGEETAKRPRRQSVKKINSGD
ncbi:MAG: DUF502 domain-containing protein [Puniceicoccales bacterium]|jgi:uncharacterized membrane protein|nr:DUF502 domain-containing protein [Puniceicoccales bacterium]